MSQENAGGFEAAIDRLARMEGRRVSVSVLAADDSPRKILYLTGVLRRGELDRAPSLDEAVGLPDDPQRIWFWIDAGRSGAVNLYLAPSWVTSAEVLGRAGLEIRLAEVTLMVMELTWLEETREQTKRKK
jgi:hypothetical protein